MNEEKEEQGSSYGDWMMDWEDTDIPARKKDPIPRTPTDLSASFDSSDEEDDDITEITSEMSSTILSSPRDGAQSGVRAISTPSQSSSCPANSLLRCSSPISIPRKQSQSLDAQGVDEESTYFLAPHLWTQSSPEDHFRNTSKKVRPMWETRALIREEQERMSRNKPTSLDF